MLANYAIILTACAALAGGPRESTAVVAVLIDDIGYRLQDGMAAIALPGPIAYAILPDTPHTVDLAESAYASHKEVLLHLPMEANQNNHLLGPDAIAISMDAEQVTHVFERALAAVPHAIGVSNHMGSRFTGELTNMRWLMAAVRAKNGLFFVDSRTTARSVAVTAAGEANVPITVRDVFLDNIRSVRYIEQQLDRLAEKARRNGTALGIAHPYPETIEVLSTWRPESAGIKLVSVTELVRREQQQQPLPQDCAAAP